MEDQKEILSLEQFSQQQITLEKQISTQEVLQQRDNEQLIHSQFEQQQQTAQSLTTQTEMKSETFQELSQKNYSKEVLQKSFQQIDLIAFESDEKHQENNQIRKLFELKKETTQLHLSQQPQTFIFDDYLINENSNTNKQIIKNEKRKSNDLRIFPQLGPLKNEKQIQKNKISTQNQFILDNQEQIIFQYQKHSLINTQLNEELKLETLPIQRSTPQQPNVFKIIDIQQQNPIIEDESQNQQQQQQQQQNKFRKSYLLIALFLVVIIAISLGCGLGLRQNNLENSDEKNFVNYQYSVNKTLGFSAQCHTIQTTIQKDGKQSTTETVIAYNLKVLCQDVTDEYGTTTYEVGKEQQAQQQPGIRDFVKRTFQNRLLDDQNTEQSEMTGDDTVYLDEDDIDSMTISEDFPFSKENILVSTAEIVSVNISKSGEILDIIFPINLESNFQYIIPKLLSTLSPSVLKENYNIVSEQSGNKRILQQGKEVTGKNLEGDFVMSKMDKHDIEDGGIKLVKAYNQTTQNNYTQTTDSFEQTTFNKKGYITQAEVITTQKIGNPNNQEDIIHSIDIKQNFRVQFLQEETITEDEYKDVFSVYELMSKFGMPWSVFFKVLNQNRGEEIQNISLTDDEKKEQPLVAKNQQVDTNQNTRLLSENGELLEKLNVVIFSKSILSIPMKSFVSFQCEKPNGLNEKDQCKTQIFLSFLNNNIPVSPVKKGFKYLILQQQISQ